MAISLDVGTSFFVSARKKDDGNIKYIKLRNAFFSLEETDLMRSMMESIKVSYVSKDNQLYVLGEAGLELAASFNAEARRPMSQGMLSPREKEALPIIKLMLIELLKEPKHPGELCYYSIPANPLDAPKDVNYHEGMIKGLIESLGFKAVPMNEALAVIYSELLPTKFTGLGISFGAGMCLGGNTKVPLLNGEVRTMKELSKEYKNKTFWVYSCTEDGSIVPGLASNPHKIKTSKVIRIWFDNDKYLDCTADHKIMLRNGKYKEARDLAIGESLMPLYLFDNTIDRRKGYRKVKDNKTRRKNSVHRLVFKKFNRCELKKDDIIHHKDLNPSNNSPENLQLTNRKEHQSIHKNLSKWVLENLKGKTYEEAYGKELGTLYRKNKSDAHKREEYYNSSQWEKGRIPFNKNKTNIELFGIERAAEISNNIKVKRKNQAMKKGRDHWRYAPKEIRVCLHCNKKFECKVTGKQKFCSQECASDNRIGKKRASWIIEKIKNTPNKGRFKKGHSSHTKGNFGSLHPKFGTRYLSGYNKQIQDYLLSSENQSCFNHKVTRIEKTALLEDVYDLTVEKYHNFATDAGVFVHNCNICFANMSVPIFTFSIASGGDWIDTMVAQSQGVVASRITQIKEKDLDLSKDQEDIILQSLKIYYRTLLKNVLGICKKKFQESAELPIFNDGISIVVAGGTSMPKGFLQLLKEQIEESHLQIKIKEVIQAKSPLYAVSAGLLTACQAAEQKEVKKKPLKTSDVPPS